MIDIMVCCAGMKAAIVLAILSLQPTVPTRTANTISSAVINQAHHFQLDPWLILAVIWKEDSVFDPDEENPKTHAAGLMQIYPTNFGVHSIEEIKQVERNVMMGCQILAKNIKRFGLMAALMFYSGRTRKHFGKMNYAKEVIGKYEYLLAHFAERAA